MSTGRCVLGLLAHVDAGKTTLSEAMLYAAGTIRRRGRVDRGDSWLDTDEQERRRGITIFAGQAELKLGSRLTATLLDTPGHVDFAPEMERALQALDCAVVVISAPAGVQSHTRTVWRLLRERGIPTFVFVNKTDLPGPERAETLRALRRSLSEGISDLTDPESDALLCEAMLEDWLERGAFSDEALRAAVRECRLFPCLFGSALKEEGVTELLALLDRLAPEAPDGGSFGAVIYRITRDEHDTRLTHLRLTGGRLSVRDTLRGDGWEEKAAQLRIYSGAKFASVDSVGPGVPVAVVGLSAARAGEALGAAAASLVPVLEPVLTYSVLLPEGCDIHRAADALARLEEELPELHTDRDEELRELRVRLAGPVQAEILRELLKSRFGLEVEFGPGRVLYRETIADTVEGVGHFEPLRHYAEVHLRLEPLPTGSGLCFGTECREDRLDRNWQNLILTHLTEKQHLGVLTGSPITDMKITLLAGRAHIKHTEGGDFRQATYRAVRQGLMQAESVLLEPWYRFRLEVPEDCVGRAMTDLDRMGARVEGPASEADCAVLEGRAPVAALRDYPETLTAYSRGRGRLSCVPDGYAPCADPAAVIDAIGYDPEADLINTPSSVFCSHSGSGIVAWDEVFSHMHLPAQLTAEREPEEALREQARQYCAMAATDKELRQIFERTYGPIKSTLRSPAPTARGGAPSKPYWGTPQIAGPEYLLVDGYNIIFSWEDLKALAAVDLEGARLRLIEILRNYQGVKQTPVILVFDAYKVRNNPGSVEHLGGLDVVYTKEAETADMYIERVTHQIGRRHRVRVATSDALEQMIILSHGALRVSARGFREEVDLVSKAIREFLEAQGNQS